MGYRRGAGEGLYGAVVLLCIGQLGCTERRDTPPPVSVVISAGPVGTRATEMSAAPAVAGHPNVSVIEPDLILGLDEPAVFSSAVDIAAAGDGRFAVLDRMERQVVVFGPNGELTTSFGRRGEGPGEFAFPVGIEWLESGEIIVWDVSPNKVFTAFTPQGVVAGTASLPVPGDWSRLSFRHPYISRDGSQMGPEEVTRRLRKVTGSFFIHLIQEDEIALVQMDPDANTIVPSAALIRYAADLSVVDTVAVMRGIPYHSRGDLEIPGIYRQFEQALFSAQPVWATGSGWIAVGHGDSASIKVFSNEGHRQLEIRWPRAAVAVSDEDKLAAADWILSSRIENSAASRDMYEQASRRERREARYGTAFELTRFAQHLPQLTGLYGVRRCLMVAGFSAIDHHDGHSQTMMVINVDSGEMEGVIRLGRTPGARIKAFDKTAAYGLRRGPNGVSLVERYPLPDFQCSADPGANHQQGVQE